MLERAGLIQGGKDGPRRPRRVDPRPLAEATAWLERYREGWEHNYQQLDALLAELQHEPAGTRRVNKRSTKGRGGSR
jgi:hypothetical protein